MHTEWMIVTIIWWWQVIHSNRFAVKIRLLNFFFACYQFIQFTWLQFVMCFCFGDDRLVDHVVCIGWDRLPFEFVLKGERFAGYTLPLGSGFFQSGSLWFESYLFLWWQVGWSSSFCKVVWCGSLKIEGRGSRSLTCLGSRSWISSTDWWGSFQMQQFWVRIPSKHNNKVTHWTSMESVRQFMKVENYLQ